MDPREVLDSLDMGVAAIGPDWTIAEWSAAAARITGVPSNRAVGQSLWTALPNAKGTAYPSSARWSRASRTS